MSENIGYNEHGYGEF